MLSYDNCKTQLRNALNCCSHAHSTSIAIDHASVGALHEFCPNDFYFTSVVESTTNSCFHEQESPILTAGKIVSITCTKLFECGIAIAVTLHIQFQPTEVARPFLLRRGNEANLYWWALPLIFTSLKECNFHTYLHCA